MVQGRNWPLLMWWRRSQNLLDSDISERPPHTTTLQSPEGFSTILIYIALVRPPTGLSLWFAPGIQMDLENKKPSARHVVVFDLSISVRGPWDDEARPAARGAQNQSMNTFRLERAPRLAVPRKAQGPPSLNRRLHGFAFEKRGAEWGVPNPRVRDEKIDKVGFSRWDVDQLEPVLDARGTYMRSTPTVPRRGASWPREHGNSVLAQCRVGGIVWPSKDALRLCAGALHLGCNSPAMVPSGEMLPARPMGVEGTTSWRGPPLSPTTVARNLWLFCFQFGWPLWIGASRPSLNCASSFSSSVGRADARIERVTQKKKSKRGMPKVIRAQSGHSGLIEDTYQSKMFHSPETRTLFGGFEAAFLHMWGTVGDRRGERRRVNGHWSLPTRKIWREYLVMDDGLMMNVREPWVDPSGQPVKLINDAQPLGIPHSQAETRSVSEKINAKEDVDPPGEIQSRSIGCIDTQGACGPKNFQREKRKEGAKRREHVRTRVRPNGVIRRWQASTRADDVQIRERGQNGKRCAVTTNYGARSSVRDAIASKPNKHCALFGQDRDFGGREG
ncbi:hypothetical protein EDB83DRAFT_2321284 [Lactarius deliciosus]|nr:hypothetical protein EDB83DRAFT_2321284 [Lactarius deliciosus]